MSYKITHKAIQISIFIVLSILFAVSANAASISNCSVLDQAGTTYTLDNDILNSANSTCINIEANNIVLDCQGYRIDGINGSSTYGVYSNSSNTTIRGCNITEWSEGIYFNGSYNSLIKNSTVNNNSEYGIHMDSCTTGLGNNNITDVTASNNIGGQHGFGIFIYYSTGINTNHNLLGITANSNSEGIVVNGASNNTFTNIVATNNSEGIYVKNSNNNTFTNITLKNNTWGFTIDDYDSFSWNNILKSSYIGDSGQYGVYLDTIECSNYFYNNIFNNTNNVYFEDTYVNYWNTTNQTGTNIVNGGFIGGNYWTNSSGDGHSDTCADADQDGFCDSSYTLGTNNIDYLPLSDEYNDTFPPTVTLLYPSNSSTNDSATITFGFNTTENGACSLYLNTSGTFGINTTNNSVIAGGNNFVVTLTPDASWLWNVECNDSAGNYANASENWTLTISTLTNTVPDTLEQVINSTPTKSNATNESLTCYAKLEDNETASGLT
ncbi:MAG: right-handed parallel beta-helix repeat-containing protein, partial [Nanoarchaeota archaeon]|nr:right-handed parallel beta-helix repeat-containing protein [Nanoarchaeota archaeon]